MYRPCDKYVLKVLQDLEDLEINDKYMGYRAAAQKLANYITLSPTLPHRPTVYYPTTLGEPEVPLEVYIARIISACRVPDIVAHAALYLLSSIAQAGQPQVPHGENKWNYAVSSPTKFPRVLFRAVIGTPFSRAVKSDWDEQHLFIGAFNLAMTAYKPIFEEQRLKKFYPRRISDFCGVPEVVIEDISATFKKCVSYELETVVDAMLRQDFVLDLSELDCPLVLARQRQSPKPKDGNGNGNEKDQKKRMSLKRSIDSLWKSREKATPVKSSLRGKEIVIVGRN
ncbi:hypothetical protein AGABI2DRAFT_176439 [Agaricus bisporus var. bisporus H97]|uniref:hypothetical protein n=1 Tax=Agaricus bisporus var. bisporus (strain H97 / ATCC MYA-4626 / FGSC 10389) TaxID=936046 RepID=UPI00029F7C41|nr:hypothetical protein AGABI2DRAFT_176439 [Agaricus bisporus var. bisporus H97]EKV49830.1 hypothetical protein AGABI2DRAFT_176439 [Agaricus bisporus var. bisporus H97]